MTAKTIGKFAIFSICAIMTAFGFLPARLSAQVLTVPASGTTMVAPGDAVCMHDLTINNGNDAKALDAVKDVGCDGNRLFTWLFTGTPILPNPVDLTGRARFVKQFKVQTVPGAATTSFVPILIAVPVEWRGTLFNDGPIPTVGPLDLVGARISVNMLLRVTQGSTTVAENRFNAASHAGISGCLSIPKDGLAILNLAIKCSLVIFQGNHGVATVYLSTIVETGKTYNVELELRADLFSFDPGANLAGNIDVGNPSGNFETNLLPGGDPFGLFWTAPMSITVGTDFQRNIQGLQDEITQLRTDLNNLTQEFKTHTHVYLTGKGVGQNNTPAKTSTPLFPPLPLFP